MCCYSTVGYRVTVMCVLLYCVATVQLVTGLMLCVCVLLQFVAKVRLGTGLLLCVCVTVMCCYSTVGYRVTVMCVLL